MPIPLEASCVEAMVQMLQRSREFTIPQRKAAIEQRMAREDRQSTERMVEALSANLPAFYGREFVTKGDANG
jgi:cation diffusion facilitator CzcD-associated flavoprotein CzcO